MTTSAVDAVLEQVVGCSPPSVPRPERVAASRAEHRPALMEDAADVIRCQQADRVATVDQALQALV